MKFLNFILIVSALLSTCLISAQKDIKIDVGSNNNIGHLGKGIIPDAGVNDPHIHIFNNKAYLFASHDTIIGDKNTTYMMPNWNIYSSQDLVHWEKEFVLYPENTYIGKKIDKCFATDGASRNGKYYFYFSNFNISTGVAVSDHLGGPYTDTGKPVLTKDIKPLKNKKYDPTIFIDDDGKHYIIWGQTGWNNNSYQIAELNEDMLSIKSEPRDLVMTDNTKIKRDASYLHKHNGKYYLNAHHGQYASSDNLYGPYEYRGELEAGGDHGTFFTWHNQTYYTAGAWQAPYFRYTFLCYAHYKNNGEIVVKRPLNGKVDLGVARYDASLGNIEAECYFAASDELLKKEGATGFEVQNITNKSYLFYPKVYNITDDAQIEFSVSSAHPKGGTIEVRSESTGGKLLASCKIKSTGAWNKYVNVSCALPKLKTPQNLYLVFKGKEGELMRLDYFEIKSKKH